MKRNNKKGFTIVELVIVIAVIGILAAVLIPTFSGIISDAQENANLQEARNSYTQYLAEELDQDDYQEVSHVKVGTTYYDVNDNFKVETDIPTTGYYLDAATDEPAAFN